MKIDVIKLLIHEQVDLLQNSTDLNELLAIVTAFVDNRTTPVPEETPAELERLRQQLRAIEDGSMKFIPHEQVIRETEQLIEDFKKNRRL